MLKKEVNLIFGITASIAAYKVLPLISSLRKKGIKVFVAMTKEARQMFSSTEFAKASGQPVFSEIIPENFSWQKALKDHQIDHILLAQKANLLVVAPATANILGKTASGIADDFLTTLILATQAPVLFCPAMNSSMWKKEIVQENVRRLQKRGYFFLFPEKGLLACGMEGEGRLISGEKIEKEIFHLLKTKNKLVGKKILVTAGATWEPIDKVRFLTNKASGKMGLALAEEAFFQGAEVLLLRSVTAVSSFYPLKQEIFETVSDLERLIKKHLLYFDVLFHTAAVGDFAPEKIFSGKIESRQKLSLVLSLVPKIIEKIKSWNPQILLVGFKAVYQEKEKNLLKIAPKKLIDSKADYLVVNDVGRKDIGFGSEENEVYLFSKKGWAKKLKKASKKEIARQILDLIFSNEKS